MKAQLFLLAASALACAGCGGSSGGGTLSAPSISRIALPAGSYSTPAGADRQLAFDVSSTGTISNARINIDRLHDESNGTGIETVNGHITLSFSGFNAACIITPADVPGDYIADVTASSSTGKSTGMIVTLMTSTVN